MNKHTLAVQYLLELAGDYRRGHSYETAEEIEAQADAVSELIEATAELRTRQMDYLSQPKGERIEDKGRLVGVAARRVDAALTTLTPGQDSGGGDHV